MCRAARIAVSVLKKIALEVVAASFVIAIALLMFAYPVATSSALLGAFLVWALRYFHRELTTTSIITADLNALDYRVVRHGTNAFIIEKQVKVLWYRPWVYAIYVNGDPNGFRPMSILFTSEEKAVREIQVLRALA